MIELEIEVDIEKEIEIEVQVSIEIEIEIDIGSLSCIMRSFLLRLASKFVFSFVLCRV